MIEIYETGEVNQGNDLEAIGARAYKKTKKGFDLDSREKHVLESAKAAGDVVTHGRFTRDNEGHHFNPASRSDRKNTNDFLIKRFPKQN